MRRMMQGYYTEAAMFISAAGLTDALQCNAVNFLVGELLKNNLWSKMYAVYPMVGGTATSHKFNLIDPQDTDAAFRLDFNGTVTHSSGGVQGNGTNGYADTHFNPTTEGVGLNDFGVGCNSATDSQAPVVDMGGRNTQFVGATQMLIRISSNSYQFRINNNNTGTLTSTGATTSVGNFAMNRLNSTQLRFTRNGATSVFTQASGTLTNRNIYLMALLNNVAAASFSARQYTFFRIHQGLTDAEEATFQTIITNYNTLLGR
jgi:hypothetical protein